MRAFNFDFWSVRKDGKVKYVRAPGAKGLETFTIIVNPKMRDEVMIRAANGMFLSADTDGNLIAATPLKVVHGVDEGNLDMDGSEDEEDEVEPEGVDPSAGSTDWNISPNAFYLEQIGAVRGEYQLAKEGASTVLAKHRETAVTASDFKFLAGNGINVVQIPVAYWITLGESAPAPHPKNELQYLDKAFGWAKEHNMRVYLNLYGAPGSQNGFESSGTRDGIADWAQSTSHIDDTVAAVEFLAARYGSAENFLGLGLLNEPLASRVPLATLKDYYLRAYKAVRKHTMCAYVGIQTRVGLGSSVDELDSFMNDRSFTNVLTELNFFTPTIAEIEPNGAFSVATAKEDRIEEILDVERHSGRPALVVSWSLALPAKNLPMADYKQWAQAQTAANAHAKAGSIFFSHNLTRPLWSEFSYSHAVGSSLL